MSEMNSGLFYLFMRMNSSSSLKKSQDVNIVYKYKTRGAEEPVTEDLVDFTVVSISLITHTKTSNVLILV